MSDNPPLSGEEPFSAWAERVWQARREQASQDNTGRLATGNGAGETRIDPEGRATADTLEEAIKQRAAKWMEEGRFLVGLLQELLDENEQLRARAAAVKQDLERPRQEEDSRRPEREEIVEVAPKGDLDMASLGQMKLQDHLDAGKTKLVVDLSDVEYIDSSGLGEIVRAMKRARAVGGDVRLCGVGGQVLRIIELTGLHKAIAIHPTREDALASWT